MSGSNESFLLTWDRLEAGFLSRIRGAYAGSGDWRDRLRAAATETVRLVEAHPEQARFMVIETLAADEAGPLRQQAFLSRVGALLNDIPAQLEDPDAVAPLTSDWVVRIFFDRVYRSLSTGNPADLRPHLPQMMFLAVSAYLGTDLGRAELRIPPP
jgi:hypothetical protein